MAPQDPAETPRKGKPTNSTKPTNPLITHKNQPLTSTIHPQPRQKISRGRCESSFAASQQIGSHWFFHVELLRCTTFGELRWPVPRRLMKPERSGSRCRRIDIVQVPLGLQTPLISCMFLISYSVFTEEPGFYVGVQMILDYKMLDYNSFNRVFYGFPCWINFFKYVETHCLPRFGSLGRQGCGESTKSFDWTVTAVFQPLSRFMFWGGLMHVQRFQSRWHNVLHSLLDGGPYKPDFWDCAIYSPSTVANVYITVTRC